MFLLHTSAETAHLIDAEGRSYHIPPNEAWDVPTINGTDIPGPAGQPAYKSFTTSPDKVGAMLIRQGVYYGLVEVKVLRTPTGTTFDLDGAKEASTRARRQAEDAMLQSYVKGAKEDELAKLPIRPPSAPIQKILNERKLDLKRDFGVQPVGWILSEGAKSRDVEFAALKAETEDQKQKISDLTKMLEQLLAIEEKKSKSKQPVS